jgi:hypothetical protein
MVRLIFSSIIAVGACITVGTAQDKDVPKKTEAKKPDPPRTDSSGAGATPRAKETVPAAVPGDVQVHFLNGSIVRMVIQSEKLEIATPYGILAVPVKDVRAIEFGLHFPEGVAAKIEGAIGKLGSANYRERDNASKTLVELGPLAYPAALEASRSKELEVSRRAKDVVKQLQANHPAKDLRTTGEDKLTTPTFTIVGNILTPSIKANTELFGQVELSVAKMSTLRAVGPSVRQQEVDVVIDAAKYANAGQWMESGFESDGQTKVVITAKGLVDSWPQQPGQWMVGPAGAGGGRAMIGGNVVIAGGGGGFGAARGQIVPQIHGGALFGKIGQDGEPFMIGPRYEGTLDKEGKLYLHIAPSMWNCNSTGTYDVKITRAN